MSSINFQNMKHLTINNIKECVSPVRKILYDQSDSNSSNNNTN